MAGLLVAEDVTPGHPDRLADLVAESLVEAVQLADPLAAVGLEVALHRQLLLVTGYVAADRRSHNPLTSSESGASWLQRRVDQVVASAGYHDGWSLPLTAHYDVVVEHRTDSITEGQGFSCDQGVVVGHATPDAALDHLPVEVVAARAARDALTLVQSARTDLFGPDGK
ncbi:MAG: S-adenosylmethionine synthetase N-terminal domain-containing protein, partial [Actinomycetes bacterium]